MIIETLKLRGAIGVKDGMGLDEIELDLRDVSGLIALSGENGRGKTTVLENMQPYRVLPSRPGALHNQFFLRDSFRDVSFIVDGYHLRSQILMDAQTGRGEAYLFKNHSTKSEVNGKFSEYDKATTEIFGSQKLFFSSIFCSQKSDKFAEMKPAEFKAMLNEFLGLHRYIGWEKTAGKAASIISGRIAELDGRIEKIQAVIDSISADPETLENERNRIKQMQRRTEADRVLLKQNEQDLKDLTARKADDELTRKEIGAVTERIASSIDKDIAGYQESCEQEVVGLREKAVALSSQIKETEALIADRPAIESAKTEMAAATAKCDDNQRLLKQLTEDLDKFRAAVREKEKEASDYNQSALERKTLLREKINGLNTEITNLDNSSKGKNLIVAELEDNSKNGVGAIDAEIRFAETQMATLKERDPACQSTICSFIVAALEAEKKWPGLQAKKEALESEIESKKKAIQLDIDDLGVKIVQKRDELKSIEKEFDELDQEAVKTVESLNSEIDNLNGQVESIEKDIKGLKLKIESEEKHIDELTALADRFPEIQIAIAKLDSLKKEKESIVADGTAIKNRWDKLILAKLDEKSKSQTKIKELTDSLDEMLSEKIKLMEQKVGALKNRIAETEKEIPRVSAGIAEIEKKLAEKQTFDDQVKSIQATRHSLTIQISEWQHMAWACGKDGLRALEIDAVAPTISAYANDLMLASGLNESISILTQDENGKEILQIMVTRGDSEPVEIDLQSGGQSVWLQKGARLAMTRVFKEKSGRIIKTCMADEEDGALDAKRPASLSVCTATIWVRAVFPTAFS